MTVNSRVIKTFLLFSPEAVDIPLRNGLRVQVIPTITDLPKARKLQFAAVIANQGLLVVWDDDINNLIHRAALIERELMEIVWAADELKDPNVQEVSEKKGPAVVVLDVDEESGETLPENRPVYLMNSIYVSIVLFIIIVALGAGMREIAFETKADGNYLRCALLILLPINIFFTLVSFAFLLSDGSYHLLKMGSSSDKSLSVALLNALDQSVK